jgi:hypothetical protein
MVLGDSGRTRTYFPLLNKQPLSLELRSHSRGRTCTSDLLGMNQARCYLRHPAVLSYDPSERILQANYCDPNRRGVGGTIERILSRELHDQALG